MISKVQNKFKDILYPDAMSNLSKEAISHSAEEAICLSTGNACYGR